MHPWTFVALGGAPDPRGEKPPTGGSAYALMREDAALLVDCGVRPQLMSDDALSATLPPLTYEEVGGFSLPSLPDIDVMREAFEGDEPFFVSGPGSKHLPSLQCLRGVRTLVVVGTHAHADHIGALPWLKKLFPHATVFMTEQTLDLSMVTWRSYLNLNRGKRLLFFPQDIERLRADTLLVRPGDTLSAGPFTLSFFRAGHLLGALSVLVTAEAMPPVRIFFGGDMTRVDQHSVRGAVLPNPAREGRVDYAVLDATYAGKYLKQPLEVLTRDLAADVATCLARGGKCLFGALSMGRAQEIYGILDETELTERFPVYLAGAAAAVSRIYVRHGSLAVESVTRFLERREELANVLASGDPCVIIAPSGMYRGGFSLECVKVLAGDPRNLVAITSYQEPDSLGYAIRIAPRGDRVRVGETELALEAEVKIYSFPSHLDQADLLATMECLAPAMTFLVHGDERGMERVIAEAPTLARKAYLDEHYTLSHP